MHIAYVGGRRGRREVANNANRNVNKELYYHNNYTDYTFQRHNTIHK